MNNKFQSLILITNNMQLNHAYKLYDKLLLRGKNPLILTDYNVEVKNNKKYLVRSLNYYQEIFKINYDEIRQEAYNLCYSLAKQEVCKDITLRKLTTYKQVSLWDLSGCYIFSEFIPILYYINIADKIFDLEKPKAVYIMNGTSTMDKIFCLLCQKRLIKFTLESRNYDCIFYINKIFREYLIFLKKIKRFLLSLYFSFINLVKSLNLKKSYKIIFFTPSERFFISMLPVILKYNNDEYLAITTFFSDSIRKMKENKIFYMDFHGYKIYSLFNWNVRSFFRKMKHLVYKSAFFEKILYKELAIGSLLVNIFKGAIYQEFPERIREIDIVRKIILSYKPAVIVVMDVSYTITLIAKSLSVSVVAMQSLHAEDFVRFALPVADAITVDGNFWKDYLNKHGVNSTKVWVTGSPRFDILLNNKKLLAEKLNLVNKFDKSKKIIIFATTYSSLDVGLIGYRNIEQIRSVFNAIKNIKEAHLIIKIHPYETDFSIYKNTAKETGLLDYTIVRDVDVLKLLYNCNLLITHISGVSYEAVLMDRNVIILSSSYDFRSEDVWDFRRYSAAVFVDKLSELEGCIRNVLFDLDVESSLKKNRKEYIYEHAYKLDGNASGRVKEIIDSKINFV